MSDNIEKKVAQTILQQPTEVRVGDKTYSVAPPSVATIIMVSQYVGQMPKVLLDKKKPLEETLAYGSDCKAIGYVVAVLLLGAKAINTDIAKRKHWWNRMRKPLLERTATSLLENVTPRELHGIALNLLGGLQVADFFGFTTFLCEINLTKPTKVD